MSLCFYVLVDAMDSVEMTQNLPILFRLAATLSSAPSWSKTDANAMLPRLFVYRSASHSTNSLSLSAPIGNFWLRCQHNAETPEAQLPQCDADVETDGQPPDIERRERTILFS